MNKTVAAFLLFNILSLNIAFADISSLKELKYPNYDLLYLDNDKYEDINRRIFYLNLKLNKLFVKRVHTLWASLFPSFIIDSLNSLYSNIEYPKRLVSSLLQRDFDAVRHETKRFFINTTLGVAGLMDVADKFFDLELYSEDMEQALAKCKVKCGNYLVLPFVSSITTRDIFGRILDFALTPTTYIASPVAAAVKLGLLINRTVFIQPILKMVESNFADSYDIAKKFYGVDKYIKLSNFDRKNVLDLVDDNYDEIDLVENKEKVLQVKGSIKGENLIVSMPNDELSADIILNDFNPQNPILDSMRTALFDMVDNDKSIWSENAVWNRNFNKKIKTARVEIVPNADKYSFRYVLQKNKQSPLVIIFPSIGEGINSSHSNIMAKMFYKQGYSVVIIGSHFQWEFLKSLDKDYKVGFIKDDVKYINKLLNNIISYLSNKYDRVFLDRTAIGTSLGAYAVLFLANEQYEQGANNIDKFIAICPPFELMYAVNQIDDIIQSWQRYPNDFKQKVAITTAKVLRAFKEKEKLRENFKIMPFSNYEAKLISAFIFHQKLSDLIYTIEKKNNPTLDNKLTYDLIYNSNFKDYINRYLVGKYSYEEIENANTLSSISNYLINKDNYKIYHSLDDYLTNKKQLKELRGYCDDKLVLFNNGAHLGFLYRDEFINALTQEINLDNKKLAQNKK